MSLNTKFVGGIALALATVVGFAGSMFLGSKTQAVAPAPSGVAITTGGFSAGGFQPSGKTVQEVIAAEVRQGPDGLERTMTVHSGILAKNGQLSILNSHHYKDQANFPVVIASSSLPPGGIEAVKGKSITLLGSMGEYKGKPQFLAQRVK